jgi:hypothetical protein
MTERDIDDVVAAANHAVELLQPLANNVPKPDRKLPPRAAIAEIEELMINPAFVDPMLEYLIAQGWLRDEAERFIAGLRPVPAQLA